jgi:hypothetical protein
MALVLFMPKEDSILQLCIDFWGLNQILKKNQYFLPLVSEAINQLSGTCYYEA